MPWIIRHTKKASKDRSFNTQKRREVYDNPLWRRMRMAHLRNFPLCEICEMEDRVTLATEVHHINSFLNAETVEERDQLAFQDSNLMSLCDPCHQRCHSGDLKGTKTKEEIKNRIDQIRSDENATNN